MTKKYKSVEHTIRNITSKQPVDEGIEQIIVPAIGAATRFGGRLLSGAKNLTTNIGKSAVADLATTAAINAAGGGGTPSQSDSQEYKSPYGTPKVDVATSSSDTTPKTNISSAAVPGPKPPAIKIPTAPKISKSTKSKKTVKEESLDEMGFIGTDKYMGNPRAFTRPVPNIEPGKAAKSKSVSGARRMAKQQASPTMHGKVHEDAESEGTKKRKEIENVGRPDSGDKKLAKQGEIKTKIIDEATLSDALIKAVEEKKKAKNKNSMVEFNPKLKHVVNENK